MGINYLIKMFINANYTEKREIITLSQNQEFFILMINLMLSIY